MVKTIYYFLSLKISDFLKENNKSYKNNSLTLINAFLFSGIYFYKQNYLMSTIHLFFIQVYIV